MRETTKDLSKGTKSKIEWLVLQDTSNADNMEWAGDEETWRTKVVAVFITQNATSREENDKDNNSDNNNTPQRTQLQKRKSAKVSLRKPSRPRPNRSLLSSRRQHWRQPDSRRQTAKQRLSQAANHLEKTWRENYNSY